MEEIAKQINLLKEKGYKFAGFEYDPVMNPSGQTTVHFLFTSPDTGTDAATKTERVNISGVGPHDVTTGFPRS